MLVGIGLESRKLDAQLGAESDRGKAGHRLAPRAADNLELQRTQGNIDAQRQTQSEVAKEPKLLPAPGANAGKETACVGLSDERRCGARRMSGNPVAREAEVGARPQPVVLPRDIADIEIDGVSSYGDRGICPGHVLSRKQAVG